MLRLRRVVALRPELMYLRAIAAVVHGADQHADAVPTDRLQLLDVHHQAAVALDQQQFSVTASGGHADRRRERGAYGAELVQDMHVLGAAAVHVRYEYACEMR